MMECAVEAVLDCGYSKRYGEQSMRGEKNRSSIGSAVQSAPSDRKG